MSDRSLLTAAAVDGLGRDVVYTASWQPPVWVPALVLATASIVVFVLYRRERRLISRFRCGLLILCRLATVGLVVFMLFGWMRREYQTVLPDLVVLIDNSESMAHEDHLGDVDSREQLLRELRQVGLRNASRINLARLVLLERGESLLKRLASNYNLHLRGLVSSDRSPAASIPANAVRGLLADGKSSQLGRRVRELLEQQRGRATVALVVFSDGITTEGELLSEVAEDARRQGVPLYMVQLGTSSPQPDLRISDLVADRTVFPHDLVTVSVNLHSAGLSVSDVTVRLREEGMTTPVTQVTVSLDANQSRRVNLSFRPDAEGIFNYVVEVDSQADEQQVANNRLPYTLVVEDARIHVLFVQDYPSYEWRYLTTLLGRTLQRNGSPGQSIEMTTVLHQAEAGFVAENTMTLDTLSNEALNPEKVDVVVFGDVDPARMSQDLMERLRQFVVEEGRGIVFLAGPRFTPLAYRETPLAALLPIDLTKTQLPYAASAVSEDLTFQARLTALGQTTEFMRLVDDSQDNQRVWGDFPELHWMLETSAVLPAARVLAIHPRRVAESGDPLPLICMQFVGRGKVVYHATDESYRWSRHPEGDQHYARYWLQLIRYLCPSRNNAAEAVVNLQAGRDEYRLGDLARIVLHFGDERLAPAGDDGAVVVVQRQGGRRHRVAMSRIDNRRGEFGGEISALPVGEYRVWLAEPALPEHSPTAQFAVRNPDDEYVRLRVDSEELKAAAERSGGRYYAGTEARRLARDLPAGKQVRMQALPPTPAWNTGWLAALFVGLLVVEWSLRKHSALP